MSQVLFRSVVAVLFCATCAAEELDKFAGQFHASGYRASRYADDQGNLKPSDADKIHLISAWGEQAIGANSETFRLAAAETLYRIANNHGEQFHKLDDSELKHLRTEVGRLLKSKDDRARWHGAQAMKYVPAGNLKPLADLLKDKRFDVRRAAAESLESIADESCIPAMVTAIKTKATHNPDYPNVISLCIVRAIGHVGTESATKALRDLETLSRVESVKEAIRVELDRIAANPK